MRTILFVLCLVSVSLAQDGKPDDELVMLRNQLRSIRGVVILSGGVNVLSAIKLLADRVIELENRVVQLENK